MICPGRGRRRAMLAVLAVLATATPLAAATALPAPAHAGAAGAVALPDLRIIVPTDLISIGLDPSTGARQLRFTHITADVGRGPFEIDPSYDPQTGVSTFVQAIYRRSAPGSWVLDHKVPIAATGAWHPPSDYQFPLTAFTLNRANPDGSPGTTVATSPKSDYCITGDTMVSGVPNTPDQTFISPENCADPRAPLGWSVGWGDEYDQTDAGQPIGLNGVANGTYVLRAVVDPRHVFTESNTANDVTDTTLRIAGNTVTVLSQSEPGTVLPTVTLTSPQPGATVSGAVSVRAAAAAHPPAIVRSVQFLLDGRPLGRARTAPPYRYVWSAGAAPGKHWLSAQVADSNGNLATAPPVRVNVVRPPPLRVTRVRWRRGVLTLKLAAVPRGGRVRALLRARRGPPRILYLHGGKLVARAPRPQTLTLTLFVGGHRRGGAITLRLNQPPAVSIVNPVPGEIVSGIVPVAADATGGTPIAYLQFSLDGRGIGHRVAAAPYVSEWDTRSLARGRHVVGVRAVDVAGHAAIARVAVNVQNPAPRMTCFVMQAERNARGQGRVTTAPLHTAMAGETLLALLSADGPAAPRQQSATVSGGGLHWRRIARANRSYGDAEIWAATAPRVLTAAQISAGLAQPGYNESLTVVAMEGSDGTGASATASGASASATVKLKTLSASSLVFAVGNDWSQAGARSLPVGWVLLDQWLNGQTGDTFWSQYTNQTTGRAGTSVKASAGGPTGDRWNLAAVELVGSGG